MRDQALRWLLANDPAAGTATSTLAYLRSIGCGDPIGQQKNEIPAPDYHLERRDHCRRCRTVRENETHRVS